MQYTQSTCTYTDTHPHTYTHTHAPTQNTHTHKFPIQTSIHMYAHICTYVHPHMHEINTVRYDLIKLSHQNSPHIQHICTYIHTYIHTYAQTYVHTDIHTHIHMYVHTYMRMYTHTVYTYIRMYILYIQYTQLSLSDMRLLHDRFQVLTLCLSPGVCWENMGQALNLLAPAWNISRSYIQHNTHCHSAYTAHIQRMCRY